MTCQFIAGFILCLRVSFLCKLMYSNSSLLIVMVLFQMDNLYPKNDYTFTGRFSFSLTDTHTRPNTNKHTHTLYKASHLPSSLSLSQTLTCVIFHFPIFPFSLVRLFFKARHVLLELQRRFNLRRTAKQFCLQRPHHSWPNKAELKV